MTDSQRTALADELDKRFQKTRNETGDLMYYGEGDLVLRDAAAALRSTPASGQPSGPVTWEDIATTLCGIDGNGFYPMDCTPTQIEAYEIRAKAVAALYASPSPPTTVGVEEIIERCATVAANARHELSSIEYDEGFHAAVTHITAGIRSLIESGAKAETK